jgi:hypothetical protein
VKKNSPVGFFVCFFGVFLCFFLFFKIKFKIPKKKTFLVVFLGGFLWVGFLLPTLPVAGLAGGGALPTAAAQSGPLGRRRCGAHQVGEQVVETFVHFLRHLSKVVIKMGCCGEWWGYSIKTKVDFLKKTKRVLLLRATRDKI